MLVDHEKVVLALKAKIREASRTGKRSWGERELLGVLADLEVEYQIPEHEQGFDDRPPAGRRGVDGRLGANNEAAIEGDADSSLERSDEALSLRS